MKSMHLSDHFKWIEASSGTRKSFEFTGISIGSNHSICKKLP